MTPEMFNMVKYRILKIINYQFNGKITTKLSDVEIIGDSLLLFLKVTISHEACVMEV